MSRYIDLDLSFIPNPSALERIIGNGTISYNTNSNIVIGNDTNFDRYLNIDDNLYVGNSFIGKIRSIISSNELTLYNNAIFSTSSFIWDTIDPNLISSVSSTTSNKISDTDEKYTLTVSSSDIQEGTELLFNLQTENVPNGTLIQYEIFGIDPSSVDYAKLSGEMLVENNRSYVTLLTRSDGIDQLVQNLVFHIINRNIHVLDVRYKFSTPADIMFKTDSNAVSTSIKHLIQTINFERPFNSQLGSQVMNLLFENPSPITDILVKRTISDTINNYEPRANILDIQIESIGHDYNIKITYSIVNSNIPVTIDLKLERTR